MLERFYVNLPIRAIVKLTERLSITWNEPYLEC